VILHDTLGLTDDIRAVADRYATAGYVAVVPNLYSRGGLIRSAPTVVNQLRTGTGTAFDDIDAARALLLADPNATGRVGIVGFCIGGGLALQAASRGFQACAPYYPYLPGDMSTMDDACPVVASFGKRDLTLRGAAATLTAALAERDIPHDIHEYPDAGHSFANRLPIAPFDLIGRVIGLAYHHDSSEDAWRRVLSFFALHLAQPTL
jgi:carboxymethylenebutenolidase